MATRGWTYARRLTRIMELVAALPAEHLGMTQWRCGAQCCAMGAAVQDPVLRAEGLDEVVTWDSWMKRYQHRPAYGGAKEISAAALFLGLERWQADHLFTDYSGDECRGETARSLFLSRAADLLQEML